MFRALTASSLAVASALFLGAAAHAGEGEPQEKKMEKRIIVRSHGEPAKGALADPSQIPGDHLRVDDLDTLAVGETRSYTTEGGQEVTFTRLEGVGARYTVKAGDKEIQLGGEHELALAGTGEGRREKVIVRKQVDKESGEVAETEERIVDGPMPDLLAAEEGTETLVIEIVGESDGQATKRVVVIRTAETKTTE